MKIKSQILTCIVSGISKRVLGSTIEKKSKKFGSVDEYKQYYVCRQASKLLKARVQPEEVQKQLLPKNVQPFDIDLDILAKLKLLKKPKNAKREEVMRDYTTTRLAVKSVIKTGNNFATKQAYVEWLTGGPEQCQVASGGTCWYTALRLSDGCCDNCEFVKFCLCGLRKISKQYVD